MTIQEIHVTSIRNDSVYGHETSHCDPAGCNGHERYLTGVYPSDVKVGDVVRIDPETGAIEDDEAQP